MRLSGERIATGLALALAGASAAYGVAAARPTHPPVRGQTGADALSAVRDAAARTLQGTAEVQFELRGAHSFGPSSAPVLGSGRLDFAKGTGTETIDLGEVGKQEPGNESLVLLPSRAYLQPKSSGTAVLPKGKTWMSATLAGSESVATNFPTFTLQVESVYPQLLLEQLRGGAVAARATGAQVVEGLPAQGYEVTVDLTKALSGLSGPSAPALGQAIQSELGASGTAGSGSGTRMTIAAWVTAGRVVRLRASPPGAGVGDATMTMCCFGAPVHVAEPPPSQVVDITALTPSGERENNGGGDSDGG
jgi:hypothetical protein